MRDRLLGLGHDAVVGSHEQHGDVGHLGAACPHGGEGLVSRRVEEGDLPPVAVDLVRADVLRDAPGLGGDDRGLADRIQQGRLAVVDVPHDRHHGGPRHEIGLVVLVGLRLFVLIRCVLDRQLALGSELGPDELDLVVCQGLRDRDRLPQAHHEHDDLGRRHAEGLRQVAHSDARLDGDRTGRSDNLARGLRPGCLALALLLTGVARPRGGIVDHDAPLAPLAGTTLTRPHGPVWSV